MDTDEYIQFEKVTQEFLNMYRELEEKTNKLDNIVGVIHHNVGTESLVTWNTLSDLDVTLHNLRVILNKYKHTTADLRGLCKCQTK